METDRGAADTQHTLPSYPSLTSNIASVALRLTLPAAPFLRRALLRVIIEPVSAIPGCSACVCGGFAHTNLSLPHSESLPALPGPPQVVLVCMERGQARLSDALRILSKMEVLPRPRPHPSRPPPVILDPVIIRPLVAALGVWGHAWAKLLAKFVAAQVRAR